MTKKTTTADDSALFRASVGKVHSLTHNSVILKPDQRPRPVPRTKTPDNSDPLQNSVDDGLETLFQEDKMAFLAPGVQKNLLKKLRKGQYGLDAEIDLHGFNSREAQHRLLHFLQSCAEDGRRSILIIHGKGYNSPNAQPVLKNDLNLWLRRHKDVQAFCSAPQKAGGAGALLLLLKSSEKFGDEDDGL